ncbi:hypothetical protein AB4874_11160 [Thioclava sp. 15-R06ZXC-3]|uniref:Uncharacterized protein n=1 Tax=Thioclava arctica TaxID=3238301 RepID=A0ABV3TLV1_9RHOB
MDAAQVRSIAIKAIDLNDYIQKNYRHFLTYDETTKIFFSRKEGRANFTKPLEGLFPHIEFAVDERAFLLKAGGAELLNLASDAKGISESFSFLHEKHKEAFYELFLVYSKGIDERNGYKLTGSIDANSIELMKMMDIEGHFHSFLVRASSSMQVFTEKIVELNNQVSQKQIRYDLTNEMPASENTHRQEIP